MSIIVKYTKGNEVFSLVKEKRGKYVFLGAVGTTFRNMREALRALDLYNRNCLSIGEPLVFKEEATFLNVPREILVMTVSDAGIYYLVPSESSPEKHTFKMVAPREASTFPNRKAAKAVIAARWKRMMKNGTKEFNTVEYVERIPR